MSDDLLAGAPVPITIADMIRCVEREIKFRKRVYPHQVHMKKMKQEEADREIAVMTEILATLKEGQAIVNKMQARNDQPDQA